MATYHHRAIRHIPRPSAADAQAQRRAIWWHGLVWVGAAALLGFALTAVFSGTLELDRTSIVLVHALVTLPLFGAYVAWSGIDPGEVIRHNWKWGVGGAVVVGALMVMAVFRQDSSARPEGQELVTDLLWFGVVYGLLDALLLSVLPVLATWHAFRSRGWTEGWVRKVGVGALAILASMLVTTAYHLGYAEYRGGDVVDPLFGNSIMTLGYVLTNNPITSVASHIAMHIAAVLQGAETTSQLPPHY